MPDSSPYNYEERTQERFVYLLCEPALWENKTYKIFKPKCYVGESKNPFRRYTQHLYRPGNPKKREWIKQLRTLAEEKPRLRILESVVSSYTPGDSMKVEKVWLWAAYLLDYDLTNASWRHFTPQNFDSLSHEYIEPIKQRSQILAKINKRPLGEVKTHEFSMDSINPIYGYTLITNDGKFINCSSREERERQWDKYPHATKEWATPKNLSQYEQHREILKKRARPGHPKKIAEWKTRPIFLKAKSWRELKRDLWDWRWTIHKKPRGGILFNGKYPVRLKEIREEWSLENLELRFGEEFTEYDPTVWQQS